MNHHNSTIVIDDYIVDRQKILGNGSNGIVYECRLSSSTNNNLCCKLINLEKIKKSNFDDYSKAEKELEILQLLKGKMSNNPYVVQLIHACKQTIDQQDFLVLIMEKCDSDLKQYLESNQTDKKMALIIIRQIINGYKICYENSIMHRDIKPANILLKNGVFKLSDFGESKITERMNEQLLQTNTGTIAYSSAQINIMGSKYSAKADIYSLGLVFYQILYGKLPFQGNKSAIHKFYETLKSNSFTPPEKGIKGEFIEQNIRDLLKLMITYEESDRISWQELFSHDLIKLKVPQQTNILFQPTFQIGKQINQQSLQHLPFKREHSESLHEIKSGQQTNQPQQLSQIPIVSNNKTSQVSKSCTLTDILNRQASQKDLQSQTIGQINQQFTPKTDFKNKNNENSSFFSNQQISSQIKLQSNQTLQNQLRFHSQSNNDTDFKAANPKSQLEKEQQIKPEQKYIQRGLKFIVKFMKEYQKIGNQSKGLVCSVANVTDICKQLLFAICYQIYQKQLNKPIIQPQFQIQDIDQLYQDKIYLEYKTNEYWKSIDQINKLLIEQLKALQQEFPYEEDKAYSKKYVWLVKRIQDIINQDIIFDQMSKSFSCDRCF